VLLQLSANLLLLKALEVSDLSRTIPFLALTPVLSGFAGQVALGQLPNALQWTGIASVSIGAGLLAFVRSDGKSDGGGSVALDRGSLMAVGTAVLWSLTAALDKLAIDASNAAMHALLQASGITIILGVALAVRGELARLRSVKKAWRGCLWAIGFGAAALAFQFMAIERIWVSLMETIKRATGAVSSLVVGRIWFRESIDGSKLAAVLLIVAGTALSLLP
jgi:drug/metabolite transporter (DMT)-like permease